MPLLQRIRHWFSLQGTVSRKEYVLVGLSLMILKYSLEALVIGYFSQSFYSPLDFFNPLLSARSQFTTDAPSWLGMAWVLWTIPFLWIAVTMSVRRAIEAGISPWAGMLVLVPVFNYLLMLFLAAIPAGYVNCKHVASTAKKTVWNRNQKESLLVSGVDLEDEEHVKGVFVVNAALFGVGVGFAYMFSLVLIGVYFWGSYGAAMFFGTPLIAGAATAYIYNRWSPHSMGSTILLTIVTGGFFAAALLLLGLEGVICIAMAAPLAVPLGILGGLTGREIAKQQRRSRENHDCGFMASLMVIPILMSIETHAQPHTEFDVITSVDIDASPEQVWQSVISFPNITERPKWFFRLGISCPQGARIDGTGVGAIRHCDFTTGSFVEPITAWEAPCRLAFDVTEQPDPMTELSPYRHIHPPHLDDSFRSTRGEFRLIPLKDGRTLLEGRTWYQLEIHPHAYWTLWTDWLLHCIHGRVLRHIKHLAEDAEVAGHVARINGRIEP